MRSICGDGQSRKGIAGGTRPWPPESPCLRGQGTGTQFCRPLLGTKRPLPGPSPERRSRDLITGGGCRQSLSLQTPLPSQEQLLVGILECLTSFLLITAYEAYQRHPGTPSGQWLRPHPTAVGARSIPARGAEILRAEKTERKPEMILWQI